MSSYSEKMLEALHNEHLAEANTLLAQALETDPPEILASLAEELQQLGFLTEAKQILQKLARDFPEEDFFYLSLAEMAIEDDETDEAFDYLENIQPESENYVNRLLITADLYQLLGIPEVSETKLLQAQALAPEEPLIIFALAEFHFSTRQFGEAISEYEQLEKQGITELAGVLLDERIGSAYSMMGGFEEAIPFIERSLENGRTSDRLFQLGFLYYQLHDHQRAIQYFQELENADPQYQSVYYYLAEALREEELLDEALKAAEKGIREDPYQVELLHLASELSYRLHDAQKAEELLLQALEVGEKEDDTRLTLSNLYLAEENPTKAIEMVEKMEDPENPYAEWNLAKAFNLLESFEEARGYYRSAYAGLAHEAEFLKEYGLFLREDGHLAEAKEVLSAYLQMEPEDLEIQSLLDDLLGG